MLGIDNTFGKQAAIQPIRSVLKKVVIIHISTHSELTTFINYNYCTNCGFIRNVISVCIKQTKLHCKAIIELLLLGLLLLLRMTFLVKLEEHRLLEQKSFGEFQKVCSLGTG